MWPRIYEQIFVPPPHEGATCNLVSICPAVLEELLFENVDDVDDADDADWGNGEPTTVNHISSPGTFGYGDLKLYGGH